MNQEKERLSTSDIAETDIAGMPKRQQPGTAMAQEESYSQLFPSQDAENLRRQWEDVQAGFVDEPRGAVQEADALVASAVKRIAEIFSDERQKLERQWDQGGDVSTEDLRQALRRYRSFFHRILSM